MDLRCGGPIKSFVGDFMAFQMFFTAPISLQTFFNLHTNPSFGLFFRVERMKLSAKPVSSPGWAEKYPPPLMRFMRTNVGSRSRGRLRSSPMLVWKKNNAAAAAVETTKEPSSPKVTFMGASPGRDVLLQARPVATQKELRRPDGGGDASGSETPCFATGKSGPKSFGPIWRKWVPFFQVGFSGKHEIKNEKSEKSQIEEMIFRAENGVSDIEDDQEDEEYQKKARAFVSSSTTPDSEIQSAVVELDSPDLEHFPA